MSTTPLIRVDTTVKTNVKGSKVFALAFVKVTGVTDSFTEDQIRGFVLPKLGDASLLGSAIVQLDSVTSGEKYHSGRGDESFTGILTQVFVLDQVAPDLTTNVTTTVQGADFTDSGINVYFMTMDGINETAVNINKDPGTYKLWRLLLSEVHSEYFQSGDMEDGGPSVEGTTNRNNLYPIEEKRIGFVNKNGEDILVNHNVYEADGVTKWTGESDLSMAVYKRETTTPTDDLRELSPDMDMYAMYVHNGVNLPNPFTTLNNKPVNNGSRSFSFMNDFGDHPSNTFNTYKSGLGYYTYWDNISNNGASIVMNFKDGISPYQFHQLGLQGVMKSDTLAYYWHSVGKVLKLQYYKGNASGSSYDHSNWTDYATLTHFGDGNTPTDTSVPRNAFPMWRNITEGAVIESEK